MLPCFANDEPVPKGPLQRRHGRGLAAGAPDANVPRQERVGAHGGAFPVFGDPAWGTSGPVALTPRSASQQFSKLDCGSSHC